jgi:hypothetical protein
MLSNHTCSHLSTGTSILLLHQNRYWALDNGQYGLGVDLLCSSPSEKQFHHVILSSLLEQKSYLDAFRFMSICAPVASCREDSVIQMMVVFESSGLHDAILFCREAGEDLNLFVDCLKYCFSKPGMTLFV